MRISKILKILGVALIVLTVFYGGIFLVWQGRIYPNIALAGVDISNKTPAGAKELLKNKLAIFTSQPLIIVYKDRTWELAPDKIELDFKLNQSLDSAYHLYRTKPYQFFLAFFKKQNLPLEIKYNQDKWQEFIDKEIKSIEIEEQSADIILINREVVLSPQITGLKVRANEFSQILHHRLAYLESKPINIPSQIAEPDITDLMVKTKLNTLDQILEKKLILTYKNKTWEIKPDNLIDWLKLSKELTPEGNRLKIGLNFDLVKNYLETIVAPDIETKSKNALFKMENGKVTAFQLGQDGLGVDYLKLIPNLEQALLDSDIAKEVSLTIPMTVTKATVRGDNAAEMGITELVAIGESDFAGSPANRIHNIKVGAGRFNGSLIAPGEEFSFNTILGEVDGTHGFKPELVIKPDGIKPEYGGGLCQVSTTVFRAALNAGLPITQRRNHSLLVSYYKPYGTDATIYPGVHDVKFINDTGHNILIQTKIIGNKLYFEFYGTKDDRQIITTNPVFTSSFVDPGPPKYIETNTLPKGVKQEVGHAFRGVSTVFYRTVTYPDGREKKDTFASKYKPWKAVYLVGTKE